jgi:hypothetical protein
MLGRNIWADDSADLVDRMYRKMFYSDSAFSSEAERLLIDAIDSVLIEDTLRADIHGALYAA